VAGFDSLAAQGDTSGHGNAEGLYSSEIAIRPGGSNSYAGDAVGVEYRTDPDATAATLPKDLSPDPNSNGHAVMMFLDWQFTAQDDEYLEPGSLSISRGVYSDRRNVPRRAGHVMSVHLCRQ
jgi:hypothetical protein